MNNYRVSDFKKVLKAKGYKFSRQNGSHRVYTNGKKTISFPANNKELNGCLAKRLLKEM